MGRFAFLVFALLLMVGCPMKNLAPDTPSAPVGTSVVPKDSTASFSSSATDPDNDSVAVMFDWGDGATSEWSNWVTSGDTVTMSHVWTDTGRFELTTMAKDRQDAMSGWSAILAVSITSGSPPNQPPSAPTGPSGPSSAPRDSVCTFTATATDPDSDGICYRFDWGNGDTSDWSDWVQSGKSRSASKGWLRCGTYSVRTQAKDVHEACSPWSGPLQVEIFVRPGTLRWRLFNGVYSSSPAIADDGTVYVTSSNYYLLANDPDGALKWRYPTGGYVTWSSPAIATDGTVYIASRDNYLYAVNPDGTLKWRYWVDCVGSSPAVAADGVVYFGSADSCVCAVNPDGTLKWRYRTGGSVVSPAVAADGTVYAGSQDSCLYAIDPEGHLKWRYQTGSWVSSPAIGSDCTVYVGSLDGCVYAINPDTTLRWCFSADHFTPASSPTIATDGTVYVGSYDSCLYAIGQDGTFSWRCQTSGRVGSSPAIAADGTVYVGSDDHYLYAINPDGSLKWRYLTGGWVESSPAIATDGTVYVGSTGYLYAINADSPLADSPWPKFHHDNKNTGRVGGGRR